MPVPFPSTPFQLALRGALGQVRHLSTVPVRSATGTVAEVYAAVETEFGLLAPPVALHAPAPDLLVAVWSLLRESLLVGGTVPRAAKEAVATGVSLANACPYCVEVHAAVLGGLEPGSGARGLRAGGLPAVTEPRLRDLVRWGRDGGPAPGEDGTVPELLAVVLAFHYLNRVVHVFLGPSPLPPGLPPAAGGIVSNLLGRALAPVARKARRSASSDEDVEPPADLSWAAPRPALARALGRVVAAVDGQGVRVLGGDERHAVRRALALPLDALPPAALGERIAALLADVPPGRRPAARLAVLTAVAPHRVDDTVIEDYRASAPERHADADLLAVVAWAALTAARELTGRRAARQRSASAPGGRSRRCGSIAEG